MSDLFLLEYDCFLLPLAIVFATPWMNSNHLAVYLLLWGSILLLLHFQPSFSAFSNTDIALLFSFLMGFGLVDHNFLRLCSQLFVLLLFFPQPFLLPLRQDEFVCTEAFALQVDVQQDEVKQQKSEDGVDRSTDPPHHEPSQIGRVLGLGCQKGNS